MFGTAGFGGCEFSGLGKQLYHQKRSIVVAVSSRVLGLVGAQAFVCGSKLFGLGCSLLWGLVFYGLFFDLGFCYLPGAMVCVWGQPEPKT